MFDRARRFARRSRSCRPASPRTYTLTPFITVPTPANGTAVLTVPPATTATWTAGRYYYDLKFTDAAAAVSYYLAGTIDVLPAVTP